MRNAMLRGLLIVAGLSSVAAFASAPRMSMTGFGQVRIGLTVPALETVLGRKFGPPTDEDEVACRYVSAEDLFPGIGFMLLDGRLARIDVDAPGVPTLSGASVGDSQESVIARYRSQLEVQTHAYSGPEGKYLTLFSSDKRYGIRFETDGSVVTRYYAGTGEAVQYIEGCQ